MSFFRFNRIFNNDNRTTRGMYFGKPEAEGETVPGQSLKEYYEDFLHISDAFQQGCFIFTGRKGVGKSAFVKHLLDNEGEDNEIYCDVVTNNNVNLEKIIQSIPSEIINKDEVIFEWIILTRMIKLLLKNKSGSASKGYDSLRKFESKNSGIANVENWMPIEEESHSGLSVNFSDLWKGFPFAFTKKFQSKHMRAPFYTLIPSLKEIVSSMLNYDTYANINFILMFDDLDVNFKLNDLSHKERLMSLLRVTKQYNTQVFPNPNSRVLIMLRDDIALQLDGVAPDKNKMFSSYEFNLNWYESDNRNNEQNITLRQFINKRIVVCFDKLNIPYNEEDPWLSLVDNTPCANYNNKTAFKYILDHTFYRPRDLVVLFRDIDKKDYPIPLNSFFVKQLLKNYVDWNANEIKDELSNSYSPEQIGFIFNIFEKIAERGTSYKYEDVLNFFIEAGLMESDFEKMLEYSFIIPIDCNQYQYFSYRERPKVSKKDSYIYRLPKCLYIYFHLNYF